MEERDYYEVLGLHPSADHAMIVEAYWHLARRCKAAMDRDGSVAQRLEELNQAYNVLGSPDARTQYDESRARRPRPFPGFSEAAPKRMSIEVSFWNLPGWQAMLAATCTFALAAVALFAGARPLVVLILAAVAIIAALLVLPDGILHLGRVPIRQRWKRDIGALEIQRSTAQIIERWRRGSASEKSDALASLSTAVSNAPQHRRKPKTGD